MPLMELHPITSKKETRRREREGVCNSRPREEEENVDEVLDEEAYDRETQFKYSTHDPNVKWNRMKPQEGERYESAHQLKLYLTNHAISKGYHIRFNKCDSVRLHCVCASDPEKFGYPYYVKASWMSTEKSFQIKKMYPHHNCVKNFNNGKLMGPTWLARQFLKELITTPNLKAKEIQKNFNTNFTLRFHG
uniref:Transposase MuDR plant domain-containing protein n=1 Tax=Lactuca sativa TaxID=4236 RepID=A0A9R1XKX2_LACSA|nr:hypothetical protein LSAT_V11C400161930 [Lactuca sativa]